ncbi:hypothetical protein ABT061_35850 [Streptosporangium sp. NPDC002544]|uniref:hypothetical protein n=1 Tax=Streptosporangium sp. NPDC002544 TaxID=3154538 RepID=UPI00331D71B6
MTLRDQWEDAERGAADRLDGLLDLGDPVDAEQTERQVAEGGHEAGAIAEVCLMVVFVRLVEQVFRDNEAVPPGPRYAAFQLEDKGRQR